MKLLFNDKQTKTEKHIAKEIVNLGKGFDNLSIEEFANYARVSSAMIVKYAKNCGFSGYKELKYYVINNRIKTVTVNNDYLQFQQEKVQSFFNYITKNPELLTILSEAILKAKYVVFYGQGPSLGVANYFASKLSVVSKKPIIVQSDEQIMELEIEQSHPERLIIMLSASLKTPLIIDKIKHMEKTGDNYYVIYENDNLNINYTNGIKLSDIEVEYDYHTLRDRTLYFLYFELINNKICEKIHRT